MLALSCHTVNDRDAMRFRIAAHAPTEPARQPHQMGVIKGFVRTSERPPPDAETTGTVRHPKIGIQNNAIHAIVAAAQQISIELTQSVHHRLRSRHAAEPRCLSDTNMPITAGRLSRGAS